MSEHHPAGHAHHHTMHHTQEPPAEPRYPEHPELAHSPGNLRGSEAPPAHPPHHGHGTHDHHEGGHDKHAGHSVEMFRNKFWISLLLTIPTVIWGHMLMRLTGYMPPAFPGSLWIAPVFGTAVFFYGGWVFLQGALRELKDRLPGMMTLISLAITVAFVFSVVVTLGYPGMPLWEELATLVTIMLLGHWMEMRSITQAQGALSELAKLLPSTAERLVDGRTETVSIAALNPGDLVLVRPGASVSADVAVEAGDVVLVRSDPRDVPRIIELSKATYRKMIQNLWWAAGYNIVAIPLAAGVLQPWGIVLSPAIGAVLMSASTVIVAINAQLLRRTATS